MVVELRIWGFGGEIPRLLVQLRKPLHRRNRDTAAVGKRLSREGNNPDYS